MASQKHSISKYHVNAAKMHVIMSGSVRVKFCKKLMSSFRERYVELVYVEEKVNDNVTSGHYEMRLYKNDKKTQDSVYSFRLNPTSLKFYLNDLKSKKHPFTFSFIFI